MASPLTQWAMANLTREERIVINLRHLLRLNFPAIDLILELPQHRARETYARAYALIRDHVLEGLSTDG